MQIKRGRPKGFQIQTTYTLECHRCGREAYKKIVIRNPLCSVCRRNVSWKTLKQSPKIVITKTQRHLELLAIANGDI